MALIVIEGLDGSGKGTQSRLLEEALRQEGVPVRKVSFPDYASPSSALVKMYLAGEFGDEPEDVNAYAAGAFYAVDRFASFKKDWQKDYEGGTVILADRYATSNMIYQLSKLPKENWEDYLRWTEEFEYGKLGLPRPDRVLFLDMPIEISQKLLSRRYQGREEKKDIHERDVAFLQSCREAALFAAARLDWKLLPCAGETEPLPVEEICRRVRACVEDVLNKQKG